MRFALFTPLALAVAASAFVQPLAAAPIFYVETGQLSGSLGSTVLTDASFTFTFYGDTANITSLSSSLLNPATSNSISIGASNGSFTTAVDAGVNPSYTSSSGIVGFTDPSENNGITFVSTGAYGYDLATPISVSSVSAFYDEGSLATTLGTLTITGAQDLTFTATGGVPEPSTCGISALALLGFVLLGRAKGKKVNGV
jgi:hypothetical protein